MKREQVVGLLFLVGLSAAVSGCATTTAPSRRVFVSDAHVKVVGIGGGSVTGGPIACASPVGTSTYEASDGPSEGGSCSGSVEDL